MTRVDALKPVFVELMPETRVDGELYISMEYAIAIHRCCCGCGNEAVTQLSPIKWSLIFDGKTVSLRPSVGNWSFPCQSHYFVTKNRVEWMPQWSQTSIDRGREREQHESQAYFDVVAPVLSVAPHA